MRGMLARCMGILVVVALLAIPPTTNAEPSDTSFDVPDGMEFDPVIEREAASLAVAGGEYEDILARLGAEHAVDPIAATLMEDHPDTFAGVS